MTESARDEIRALILEAINLSWEHTSFLSRLNKARDIALMMGLDYGALLAEARLQSTQAELERINADPSPKAASTTLKASIFFAQFLTHHPRAE